MEPSVYTVGQVNAYIKNLFEQDFALRRIYVKGEISNCRYHASGHIFFTLKDESGVINAVMFKSRRQNLKIRLQDGMTIVAGGSINIFERDGKYELFVQTARAEGVGELYQRYEKLKNELSEMGMFAPEYKQPIPRFCRRIGVVTAPGGAAIRDICNVASRRNPCVQLYLYPALVQGEQAASTIAAGISRLDEMGLDCIIVGRGGGSLEDLWAFNEEETAYAIFHAQTPIISAVGHETDFTIADFVADLRAPTPSAAAELAVFDYAAWQNTLQVRKDQLDAAMDRQLERKKNQLETCERRLKLLDPVSVLEQKKQHLEHLKQQMNHSIQDKVKDCRHRISLCAGRLEAMSPLKKLSGGYAYVTDQEEHAVWSASALEIGQVVSLRFADGKVLAQVKGKTEETETTDLTGKTEETETADLTGKTEEAETADLTTYND